jgi:hypothetical protein
VPGHYQPMHGDFVVVRPTASSPPGEMVKPPRPGDALDGEHALPPGAVRRRTAFGLLDADGWTWASIKASFWFC